ncbi:MAG: hypothetical protein COW02_20050 [Comamonadaceae bacterium CG12_big_fil_rev_8_21_14_0_65_59_15]|nr:MAG: hypothetical protein COW02_20050 [Comamonadaceae bacterium CG12_big_fil_rev_8_21_14_0_65_59_15]
MKTNIATLISVYSGDDPSAFNVAIESILDQQFMGDIQSRLYLAVDGPVPNEIDLVIQKFRTKIYLVLRIEINGGLAAALNALIRKLSDEDFIFRMDADDRSHSNRYQSQLNYFKLHPDIDILGTDIIEVDTVNNTQRRVSFCSGPTDALTNLCRGVPVAHPTVCFRRKVFHKIDGYPISGTNEDIALWFQCARKGLKFDNVHEALLDFTVGPNFWRRRSLKKAFNELRCYVIGIWSINGITWRYVYPLMRFVMRISPLWLSKLLYASPLRRRSAR